MWPRSCSLAATAALLLWAPDAAAQDGRHNLLFYTHAYDPNVQAVAEMPLTAEIARRLLAFELEDGTAADWLFDGMVLFSTRVYQTTTQSELDDYRNYLFSGGKVQLLADTVSTLRSELGDPDYRLRIYLTASLPPSGTTAAPYVDQLLNDWAGVNRPELELVGFYWGQRETVGNLSYVYETNTATHVHAQGLSFVWIPAPNWPGPTLQTLGFDQAALQPNYHKCDPGVHDCGYCTWDMFQCIDNRIISWDHSGAEFELGHASNSTLPDPKVVNNALGYFRAADHFNWTQLPWNAYYYGPVIADFADPGPERVIYDGVYRTIAAHPRSSVARRETLSPVADSFIETLAAQADVNRGDAAFLDVGVNGLGNQTRTYLKFDIPDTALQPLAAHLHLTLFDVYEASYVNQADLYVCDNDWEEMLITGNDQPSCSGSAFGAHRVHLQAPRRHSFDLTDEVDAAAGGELTLMLRGSPNNTMGTAMFRSREASSSSERPTLTIVYPGPEPGTGGAGASSAGGNGTGAESVGGNGTGAMAGWGTGGDGAAPGADPGADGLDGDCSCRVAGAPRGFGWAGLAWLASLGLATGRRRGRREIEGGRGGRGPS